MEIRCIIEDSDKENLVDPSGEILISDGISTIRDPLVYLDAWLEGLIIAVQELQAGRSVSIDVEEPERVNFLLLDAGGVRIEYKQVSVYATTIQDFSDAVKTAARDFIGQIDLIGDASKNESIRLIRRFVTGG